MFEEVKDKLNSVFMKAIKNEIEALDKKMEDKQAGKIEELVELKIKVKPKLVVVKRELENVVEIFKAYQNKNEACSKLVLTKRLEFYLEALKFDSGKVIGSLDDEIEVMKRV